MIIQIIALFCCGTFYGAALYISLAQHPAVLEAGVSVGGRFFSPMYKRAAPLQVALALVSFIAGILAWFNGMGLLWLVGGLLHISVVPITLILIKPITDRLLAPENDPESENTQILLSRWGSKHWLRTIVIWLVGGLLHISVVPITLILIKPITDRLLAPENDPESENTQILLSRWGSKHWLRTIVSGAAFLVYLFAVVSTNV